MSDSTTLSQTQSQILEELTKIRDTLHHLSKRLTTLNTHIGSESASLRPETDYVLTDPSELEMVEGPLGPAAARRNELLQRQEKGYRESDLVGLVADVKKVVEGCYKGVEGLVGKSALV